MVLQKHKPEVLEKKQERTGFSLLYKHLLMMPSWHSGEKGLQCFGRDIVLTCNSCYCLVPLLQSTRNFISERDSWFLKCPLYLKQSNTRKQGKSLAKWNSKKKKMYFEQIKLFDFKLGCSHCTHHSRKF